MVKIFRNSLNMARIGAKLCQNAFQTIPDISLFDAQNFRSAKFSDIFLCVSQILVGFGGRRVKRTSKSNASSNFALDLLIQRSVRPENLGFGR